MKIRQSGVFLQDRGALRRKANRLARICTKQISVGGYNSALKILVEQHITEPASQQEELAGKISRLCCSDWWMRQLTKQSERACEGSAIKRGLVRRDVSAYISETLFKHMVAKQKASIETIEKLEVVNVATGEVLDMATVKKGSLSNPKNKFAELLMRCSGFERYAKKQGHIAAFYTITAPSKYHSRGLNEATNKTYKNRHYNGATPSDTQRYLVKLWSRIRSKLKRDGLNCYGFRVCEPHHDGTPHWHLLLFMGPEHEKLVTQIMKRYALDEDGDESGAAEHRFKVKLIDDEKGSATGYTVKYISKNIDGLWLTKDFESGLDASEGAERVRAWASLWGIRQFQMIGGAPVGVWRELRRAKKCPGGLLSEAMQAADAGDWEQYLMLQGGADIDRKKQPIKNYRVKRFNPETGKPLTNKYGESVYKVEGVRLADGSSVQTRFDEWTIQRKPAESQPTNQSKFDQLVSAENPIAVNSSRSVSWSFVNNCTHQTLEADSLSRSTILQHTTSLWPDSSFPKQDNFKIP